MLNVNMTVGTTSSSTAVTVPAGANAVMLSSPATAGTVIYVNLGGATATTANVPVQTRVNPLFVRINPSITTVSAIASTGASNALSLTFGSIG